jgi:2-oxoglutarate/2-oxoacid ferredoxin oxidoreductase subunit alpha
VNEVSVLIGGKAGDGITNAGTLIAQILSHHGYFVYMYTDYPSLIRGGHNFAIVRAAENPVSVHRNRVDFILALDQRTVDQHRDASPESIMIVNADLVKMSHDAQEISIRTILTAETAPAIMGNSAMIGAFAKAAGIAWDTVDVVFHTHVPKGLEQNLRVARRAYDTVLTVRTIGPRSRPSQPLITGNEAISLGLVKAGLSAYVSYPMTPSSGILHFLAEHADRFCVDVIHPENEIAVILMALGFSYAGRKVAVGTSGGGFCLMTEGLSLAGMAELPVVIIVSQRTGPSTGLPTYTGQSELGFVLHAGQGEFPRLVVAPADASEAYYWSAIAMRLAGKFQVPACILSDKTLSEGMYCFDPEKTSYAVAEAQEPLLWDKLPPYSRYRDLPAGISPLAYPGERDAVVKVNGYSHDESGITTEDAGLVSLMAKKRIRKGMGLASALVEYHTVNVGGIRDAPVAILCWGSVRGACEEVAVTLGLRVVQPVVLAPFPSGQLADACTGVTRLIGVEENATGQLAALAREQGFVVHGDILKYDGRPFTPDELLVRVREVLAQ